MLRDRPRYIRKGLVLCEKSPGTFAKKCFGKRHEENIFLLMSVGGNGVTAHLSSKTFAIRKASFPIANFSDFRGI